MKILLLRDLPEFVPMLREVLFEKMLRAEPAPARECGDRECQNDNG